MLRINQKGRTLLKMQLHPEDLLQRFQRIVENVNVINAAYNDEGGPMGAVRVVPSTFDFGSGLHG